jgi:hypothetical protein
MHTMIAAIRSAAQLPKSLAKLAQAALVVALASGAGLALADTASDGWHALYEEQGILVSTREEPGIDLPGMRGQTKLQAEVRHLLAVVLDDRRSTEWAKGADETTVLRSSDARGQFIYAHSRQPWPVRDRDLVMKRTVEVLEPGKAYRVHLVCVPNERPLVEGVVRVEHCETTFLLRAVDATHTEIDYRVQADPGGKIPAWIVRRASRSIPLDTLLGLAKQVELTRGQYRTPVNDAAYAAR